MENQPRYSKCKVAVLDYMVKNECTSGTLLPSQRMLCEMTGHSMITVRRALADLETEGFVRAEPGRGCFVARDLSGSTTGRGTILLFDLVHTFRALDANLRFLQGELRTRGYELRVISAPDRPLPYMTSELSRAFGVLVCGRMDAQWVDFFATARCPLIVVGDSDDALPYKCVRHDYAEDVAVGLRYFAQQNIRRIGFLNAPFQYAPALRMQKMFDRTRAELGLSEADCPQVMIDDRNRSRETFKFLEQRHDRCDCFLVEHGVLTDVLSCYFEYDWKKPVLGIVGANWLEYLPQQRRIVRFGRPMELFSCAVKVLFDLLLPPEKRTYPEQHVILHSQVIEPLNLSDAEETK